MATLHPGQIKAHSSKARRIFVISGAQGGKTTYGPIWLYREILKRGAGDYLAVTSTYDLFRVKMLPAMKEYFCDLLGIGKYWAGAGIIEIMDPQRGFLAKTQTDQMWARIILRAASSASGLESATAKAAWLDECGQDGFKYEAWEAVQRRLMLHRGRVLGTTTPYNLGWLKTEVFDRWAAGNPMYDVINFPSIMNPSFPTDEAEEAKNTWPEWRYKMFLLGEFARPAGLIYNSFDREKMTFDPKQVNILANAKTSGRVGVGVDFGGANTATLWAWLNPADSIWYVFFESLTGGMSTPEHAEGVLKKASRFARVEYYGGAFGETQYRMDWNKAGVPVMRPVTDDVEIGISAVIEAFKGGKVKIASNLTHLLNELASYARKLDKYGEPTNEIQNKNLYHMCDALRYLIVSVLGSGAWVRAPGKEE